MKLMGVYRRRFLKNAAACGASHVILGHSERRNFYQDENDLIYKVLNVSSSLTPIICIGETLSELKNNQTLSFRDFEIRSTGYIKNTEFIIAYEPIWAIGTGKLLQLSKSTMSINLFVKLLKKSTELHNQRMLELFMEVQ